MISAFLFGIFKKISNATSYNSLLDRYVASKNPKSIAEVEYWTRKFDQHFTRGFL